MRLGLAGIGQAQLRKRAHCAPVPKGEFENPSQSRMFISRGALFQLHADDPQFNLPDVLKGVSS